MRNELHSRDAGYSVVELVVVIGIIGILVGIVICVVQVSRESASFLECQNNIHQIGVALIQHHDAHGMLPSNGGWDGKQVINTTDGLPFTPSTRDYASGGTFFWGVGQSSLLPPAQTGSWCFAILPYLDQQQMYLEGDWTRAVTGLICSSRRSPMAYDVVLSDPYGAYQAGGWKWGKTDYGSNEYLIGKRPSCYRFAQITDGASNTLMIGEKAFNASIQMPSSWYFDEGFFLGGSNGTARRGLQVLRDPAIAFKQNWGSAHSSAANFLFADNSVRSFVFGTPWSIMAPLLVPNDNDVLPNAGDGL